MKAFIFIIIFPFLCHSAFAEPMIEEKTFQDWAYRCVVKKDQAKGPCVLVQNVYLNALKQRLVQCLISQPDLKTPPVALLTVPLGIALSPGVQLQIDRHKKRQYRVARCEPQGCKVAVLLKPALLAQFKAGNTAVVTFHNGQGQGVGVPISLRGISAGLRALSSNLLYSTK